MKTSLKNKITQRINRRNIYSTPQYWNTKAADYDGSSVSMWSNQALNELYDRELKEFILRNIKTINTSILDVGCGTGRISRWFSEKGAKVTGIDFSDKSLDIARSINSGDSINYIHSSITDLKIDEKYQVVFTWGVLAIACKNKEDLKLCLIKIRDLIGQNGVLILAEPIHNNFLHRVLKLSRSDFIKVMVESGFEIQQVEPLHFWPTRILMAYVPYYPAWMTKVFYSMGQLIMKLPLLNQMGDYSAIVAIIKE